VRYRVGLIVPSSNTTMETEVPALLAAHSRVCPADTFSFHSSRARMQQVSAEELRAMNDQVGRCALELSDARPDIVATACLVAVMAQGRGYHRVAEAQITEIARGQGLDSPVISSAGALVNALAALGARRVALVAPYVESLTALVVDYLEGEGLARWEAGHLHAGRQHERVAAGEIQALPVLPEIGGVEPTNCDIVIDAQADPVRNQWSRPPGCLSSPRRRPRPGPSSTPSAWSWSRPEAGTCSAEQPLQGRSSPLVVSQLPVRRIEALTAHSGGGVTEIRKQRRPRPPRR
jgi:Arylmalonate decarboxylase